MFSGWLRIHERRGGARRCQEIASKGEKQPPPGQAGVSPLVEPRQNILAARKLSMTGTLVCPQSSLKTAQLPISAWRHRLANFSQWRLILTPGNIQQTCSPIPIRAEDYKCSQFLTGYKVKCMGSSCIPLGSSQIHIYILHLATLALQDIHKNLWQ